MRFNCKDLSVYEDLDNTGVALVDITTMSNIHKLEFIIRFIIGWNHRMHYCTAGDLMMMCSSIQDTNINPVHFKS